jgi:hypothetical protein
MHKQTLIAASLLILGTVTGATTAWAGWGCGAESPVDWGVSFNASTEGTARSVALKECSDNECRIIDCRANVNTVAQAEALWRPSDAKKTSRKCKGNCGL